MLKGAIEDILTMEREAGHVLKVGLEVRRVERIVGITEDHPQVQWEDLVAEEGAQKTMVHQVEVGDTLGEAVVSEKIKPEGEGALTAVVIVVPV